MGAWGTVVSSRVSDELARKLDREAQRRGKTRARVLKEAVERMLRENEEESSHE